MHLQIKIFSIDSVLKWHWASILASWYCISIVLLEKKLVVFLLGEKVVKEGIKIRKYWIEKMQRWKHNFDDIELWSLHWPLYV